MKRNGTFLLSAAIAIGVFCATSVPASAAPIFCETLICVTVDENGHGTITIAGGVPSDLFFSLMTDPGSGGGSSVANYNFLGLLPDLVPGDLVLLEPDTNNIRSDLIRFDASHGGSLFFYSDQDGADASPADILFPGTPTTFSMPEVELLGGGRFGVVWIPAPGEPGYADGGVTYEIESDGVPEPMTLTLVGAGLLGLGVFGRRKLRK